MKNFRIAVLVATVLLLGGTSLDVLAQKRREKKTTKRAERRPELTSSASAIYGNAPMQRNYKPKTKMKVKKYSGRKPIKGIHKDGVKGSNRRRDSTL